MIAPVGIGDWRAQRRSQRLVRDIRALAPRERRRLGRLMQSDRGSSNPGRIGGGLYGGIYGTVDGSQWDTDQVEALTWPQDLQTYQKMRRSDHQTEAILRSIELPIEQGQFAVRPPPEATDQENMIADAVEDAYLRRLQGGWEMAIRASLTCLQYGFSVMEQTWEVSDIEGMSMAAPARIAYRPQISITGEMRKDGRLTGLVQTDDRNDIELPLEKLILFSVGRLAEDGWRGTSLLRAAYKAWLLKDQAERIVAIGHQRWSAGIPMIQGELDGDGKPVNVSDEERAEIEQTLRSLEADEQAFMYVPGGFKAGILDRNTNFQGHTPLDWVRHLDDAMARAILALHLTLGGAGSGSRSLGTSFVDVFLHGVQAWGDMICDEITEQSIRPMVEWNWGEQKRYPRLTVRNIYATSLERLGYLMQSGVIKPTEALERYIYESLGLDYSPEDIGSQTEVTKQTEAARNAEAAMRMMIEIRARYRDETGRDMPEPVANGTATAGGTDG